FKTPAFAPVVFNMVIIFFALNVCEYFNPPVIGLALGVTAGGFAQLILQIPFLIKKKVFKINKIVLIHPGVIIFIKRLFPTVIGASSFHINLLVLTFFASFLEKGNISYFYYADRLVQLPMALVSASLAIVFLPLFSKNAVLKNRTQSGIILLKGLKLVLFIIIPAMAGLIVLREPIVKLFFYHGAFDLVAVNKTSTCLLYLVSGLWAYSGTRILVSFFYAVSDMRTPLKAGVAAIIINFILSLVLLKTLGYIGLALAISISGAVNFIFLFYKLNLIVPFSYKDIVFSACRAVFVSGIMYFTIKILMLWMDNILDFEIPILIRVAMSIIIGILIYSGVHILIKSPEIKILKKEILKK
ncbi:MAG: polysaccharide biosynthesis C-terminal domain-containing protein, partial [Desulfobacteraceae bacterium]|nr:polysaccharide biosynthesis C-terminal domain-containing protein [Desulfobacteraceae bacterium]